MNVGRIKELKTFADNFYQRLNTNKDEPELKIAKTIQKSFSTFSPGESNPLAKMFKTSSNFPNINKKKPKLKGDIYKTLSPWVPPYFVGRYFENFNRLRDEHYMSIWEKVNIIF